MIALPLPLLPLLPGSQKLAPAGSPSAIVASSATLVPSATIRSRSSGLLPPAPLALAGGDPESFAHPRDPRPAALASRPAPASLTETRCPFQSCRLLAATRVQEHRRRRLRPLLAPTNQKPAAGEPWLDSLYKRGGGGRGHSQRGAHWPGRRLCSWRRALFVSDVRPGRQCWRGAAWRPLPPGLRLPRGSRDRFAGLRERHARAGKPGLGEPSGPPEREHAPSGLLLGPSLELVVVGEL